jgi:hypothetical protein
LKIAFEKKGGKKMFTKLLGNVAGGTTGKVLEFLPMAWVESIVFDGVKGLIKNASSSERIQEGAYELGDKIAQAIPGQSIEKSIEVIAQKLLDGIRQREKKQNN